eukprot:g986.t1
MSSLDQVTRALVRQYLAKHGPRALEVFDREQPRDESSLTSSRKIAEKLGRRGEAMYKKNKARPKEKRMGTMLDLLVKEFALKRKEAAPMDKENGRQETIGDGGRWGYAPPRKQAVAMERPKTSAGRVGAKPHSGVADRFFSGFDIVEEAAGIRPRTAPGH